MTEPAEQLAFPLPVAGLVPVDPGWANVLLARWKHNLGPCNRMFNREAWTLDIDGLGSVAVAVSATTVSDHVTGTEDGQPVRLERSEIVELARLCTHPAQKWATRPMIRLWREVAGPRFTMPTGGPASPAAAVSYSQDGRGDGSIYRFDGWTRIATGKARSGGGGKGSRSNPVRKGDPSYGPKSLWLWRYQERGAEISGTAPGHAGMPGSGRQAVSGDPGAAQGHSSPGAGSFTHRLPGSIQTHG